MELCLIFLQQSPNLKPKGNLGIKESLLLFTRNKKNNGPPKLMGLTSLKPET